MLKKDIKEGASNWPQRREAFGDAVVDTLSEYIPNFKDSILHRQVLSEYRISEAKAFMQAQGIEMRDV